MGLFSRFSFLRSASRRLRHHAVAAVVLGTIERCVGRAKDLATESPRHQRCEPRADRRVNRVVFAFGAPCRDSTHETLSELVGSMLSFLLLGIGLCIASVLVLYLYFRSKRWT